jgi:TRAP transporter 4TM/12TM fusion protein
MLPKVVAIIATALAIGMSLIHLKHPLEPFDTWTIRVLHLTIGMMIVFLIYPINRRRVGIIDILLAILAILPGAYIILFMDDIIARFAIPSTMDLVMGAICIILVLEMTRRVVGSSMVIIAIAFMLYAYFGEHMPGILAHRGHSVSRIIDHLYVALEGIFGVPLGVSATFVILFIIFGAFLEATKTGDFMMNLANSVAGRARGGPAKIAVFASALFGTISGSAVANVAATGAYTIPMMKKIGYHPRFAGAVEAAASTGGQLMPPVMGAAAFVMAELTGIAYTTIMLAAVVPAILYFGTVYIAVHLEALKRGLRGLSKEEILSKTSVFIQGGHLIIPLLVLLYVLVILRMSPMMAAIWAIGAALVVSSLRKWSRMGPKDIPKALETGAKGALSVMAACACAGIIVGMITLTGLGLRFTGIVTDLGGGNLILTLILVKIACYILGMGVPTTAAYIMVAVIGAPALIGLGVPVLAAHLFVFYSAIISAITPPVALAAITAAGIAGADPMKTALTTIRLTWLVHVVSFFFVLMPALLIIGEGIWTILAATVVSALAILILSFSTVNWMITALSPWEHITLLASGTGLAVGFILELPVIWAIALVLAPIVYLSQSGQGKRILQWRSASGK